MVMHACPRLYFQSSSHTSPPLSNVMRGLQEEGIVIYKPGSWTIARHHQKKILQAVVALRWALMVALGKPSMVMLGQGGSRIS